MPLTPQEKARARIRKALQDGREIEARTPENQRILDEVKAEIEQEASAGVKRVQDASYRGVKRVKRSIEDGLQQIDSAVKAGKAAAQADSAQDAGADSSASGVKIEDVTEDADSPVGKPVTLGPSGPFPVALNHPFPPRKKWTAEEREEALKFKKEKEQYLEQQKAKEEEDRLYKQRLDAALPEARKEVRARFPTCENCEEADWNHGGACETHQAAIDRIARGMVDREDAARQVLLKAHDAGARGL